MHAREHHGAGVATVAGAAADAAPDGVPAVLDPVVKGEAAEAAWVLRRKGGWAAGGGFGREGGREEGLEVGFRVRGRRGSEG